MKKLKFVILTLVPLLVSCGGNAPEDGKVDPETEEKEGEKEQKEDEEGKKEEDNGPKKLGPSASTYYDYGRHTFSKTYFAPSTGELNVLVVPVIIKGYESSATEEARNNINEAFFGEANSDKLRESVSTYFKKSSFGKLDIKGEVTSWIDIGMSQDDIYKANQSSYVDYGTYSVLDRVYEKLEEAHFDFSNYDSDKDGYIDCIYLVHSAPTKATSELVQGDDPLNPMISFTYWKYDEDEKERSSLKINTYSWASIDLMDAGKTVGIQVDAHTYIHEMGHVLGLVDYYDYDGIHSPLGCFDMQDFNVGDHNSYSKYALGWTSPYYINKDSKITLKPASSSGEFIILKNSAEFSGSAFDEYFILEYLTPKDLWSQDSTYAYPNVNTKTFTKSGIRMLHIDGRLLDENGKFQTIVEDAKVRHAFSNTPSKSMVTIRSSSQMKYDLISILNANNSKNTQTSPLSTASNQSLFKEGQIFTVGDYSFFLPEGELHSHESFPFKIIFGEMNEEGATLTIKKVD